MSKNYFHIVIIEKSLIVYEGISSVLSNSGIQYELQHLSDINSLEQLHNRKKIDMVIINPLWVQNIINDFLVLKKTLSETYWIAIIYSFIDPQLQHCFDDTISINDSAQKINATLQKFLFSDARIGKIDSDQENLSERETEVLKLLVQGFINKEIAEKLNITTNTVITHRKNISRKTGIKSVAGLTIYAVVNHLISIDNYLG